MLSSSSVSQPHYWKKVSWKPSEALNKIRPVVTKIKEPWPAVRWLELNAKFHQLTGQFSGARDELVEVVHICNRFKFTRATAAASVNLANVLIVMNQQSVAHGLVGSDSEKPTVSSSLPRRRAVRSIHARVASHYQFAPDRRRYSCTQALRVWARCVTDPSRNPLRPR